MEAVRGGRKPNHQDEERHDRQQAYEPDVESHRLTSGTVKSFACISAPSRTAASLACFQHRRREHASKAKSIAP
jgi:hypothetical protein